MSIFRYDLQDVSPRLTHYDAKLLYISQEKFDNDWLNIEHTHSCTELFYILEGNGFFSIENKLYPVSAHDAVIINASILHTEIGNPSLPMKYIVFGLDGLHLSTYKEEENYHHYIVSFHEYWEQVSFFLRQILFELDYKKQDFEKMCQHYMDLLLLLLARKTSIYTPASPSRRTYTRLAPMVKHYIDDHYREQVTLEQLAEFFHANKYHIVHSFKEAYEISPINYLISIRIQESQKLLSTTDYSLSEISRFCGFSSPSYFSQTFKKHLSCAPTTYRQSTVIGNLKAAPK